MGAARICPKCLVRLVTNHAHTRIWCPRCKREIRLNNVGEERGGPHPLPRPHSRHMPPPLAKPVHQQVPPPPLPASPCNGTAVLETPVAAPGCLIQRPSLRRRSAGRTMLAALLILFATALLGGGVALACYFSVPLGPGTVATAVPVAPPRPDRSTGSKPQPAPSEPSPPPKVQPAIESPSVAYARRQEKALRDVFQKDGASPTAEAKVPKGSKQIDERVVAGLKAKGIALAPLCSDAVFVRRAYLDVIGRIPTAEEAKQFLDDTAPDRRAVLIDHLLAHRDFADYWSLKWCDLLRVKSEFPINLWPNAVQAYHRWIRDAIRDNRPYDQFARELLTASGSNFRDPPTNFYRAVQKKDASTLARAVALTFMGVRPEGWPKERWEGVEPFFAQVGYKKTGEWKEEVVFFDSTRPMKAGAVFPDGVKATIEPDQDPREVFAEWLITPKNPYFTRNIANRAWSWLVGRGIIHEPDDIRPDNLPSNPELLTLLEQELIAAKYDLRQLFRVILNSNTYQASSIPASDHAEAASLFAFYPARRLEAEVLIDAICQVTGTTEKYSSPIPEPFTYIPESHRSVSLADASITSPFLEMFGRPSRDTGLESERNNNITAAQRLHLLNSAHIVKKIEQGPAMQQILRSGAGPEKIAETLYLTILSRYPTRDELAVLADYRASGGGRPGLDLAWALINTAEFLCRH